MSISNDDYRYLDKIMKLEADTKPLHAQISLQSMTYPSDGFSVPAITGTFDREKNWQNPGCYVHPVIAAMFIPKFKMVSIIPGMESRAPERTDKSKGFLRSPNFFPSCFSVSATEARTCSSRAWG